MNNTVKVCRESNMDELCEHHVGFKRIKVFLFVLISPFFYWISWKAITVFQTEPDHEQAGLVFLSGFLGFILVGGGSLFLVTRVFSKKPALIMNSDGIWDYSTAISVGFIPWDEITHFSIWTQYLSHFISVKYVRVHVSDPQKYIQQGNSFQRCFRKLNNLLYKSPIHLSSKWLNISFKELESIVRFHAERFDKDVR